MTRSLIIAGSVFFLLMQLDSFKKGSLGSGLNLDSLGTSLLTESGPQIVGASAGNYIIFGGEFDSASRPSPNVDLYNISTNAWTTSQLSVGRVNLAAAGTGNYIVFAGGRDSANISSVADIYNTSTNTWTTAHLSEARSSLAAAAAATNNNFLFAGGLYTQGSSDFYLSTADIYNVAANRWRTAKLSQPLAFCAAAAVDDLIFVAGGANSMGISTVINIYNTSTFGTTEAYLSVGRFSFGAASAGNFILFAGGSSQSVDFDRTVDIFKIAK